MRLLMDASMRFEIKDGAGWTMAEGVCSSLAAAAQIQSALVAEEKRNEDRVARFVRLMERELSIEEIDAIATQLGFVVQDRKMGGENGKGE
jgi:hypothetical protein